MRLKGKQLDGFNAALREGNQEEAMAELQGACARAEGIVPFASASGSAASSWALKLLIFARLSDFSDEMTYSIWVRNVATAGKAKDERWLEKLESEMGKRQNGALCHAEGRGER